MTPVWREHQEALEEYRDAANGYEHKRDGLGEAFMDAVDTVVQSVLDDRPDRRCGEVPGAAARPPCPVSGRDTKRMRTRSIRSGPANPEHAIFDAPWCMYGASTRAREPIQVHVEGRSRRESFGRAGHPGRHVWRGR